MLIFRVKSFLGVFETAKASEDGLYEGAFRNAAARRPSPWSGRKPMPRVLESRNGGRFCDGAPLCAGSQMCLMCKHVRPAVEPVGPKTRQVFFAPLCGLADAFIGVAVFALRAGARAGVVGDSRFGCVLLVVGDVMTVRLARLSE